MQNQELYAEATKKCDWKQIYSLNGLTFNSFGTKKEYMALSELIEDGEVVYAFASGAVSQSGTSNNSDFGTNTWLVVLTSERFLFVDCALLSKSIDTQTIRHNRVQAVSSSQGFLLGKVIVDIGSRSIVIDNCQKADVKVMADLANKLIRKLEDQGKAASSSTSNSSVPEKQSMSDKIELLGKLASLKDAGAITDEEFSVAKAKIISSL